jgi:hypothetical protein
MAMNFVGRALSLGAAHKSKFQARPGQPERSK